MREIFEDIFKNDPLDPSESARRNMRTSLRKRFYDKVEIGESADGFAVLLDGKPIRTPARRSFATPSRALSEALAAEWRAQTDAIDPARMPLTRLANSIIDGVADAPGAVADDIAKYLGSDLVFYRADEPAGLIERQAQHWDPVLDWMHKTFGSRFMLAQGVIHVMQPQDAIAAARAAFPADPWRLGALHSVTTLTGSAALALALLHGRITAEEAWQAAHVDEDWNMQTWGSDEAALARRAARFADMQAAAEFLRHIGKAQL